MTSLDQQLTEMALGIVRGESLDNIDLFGLAAIIDIDQIKPEFLPGPKTISGSPKSRKDEIFRLTSALWGVSPERWLEMENTWLKSARAKSGNQETKGKDQLDDVISTELLIRLIVTIKLVDTVGDEEVIEEAANALNLALQEAVMKGRSRIERFGDQTIYACLKNAGIMIGTGGGKYLPDPETSLPFLFQMLQRDRISAMVYR